jgi:hypothetical protein
MKKHVDSRRVPVTIRLPEKVLAEIDSTISANPVPISRNNWLIQAAVEKLQNNKAKGPDHGP